MLILLLICALYLRRGLKEKVKLTEIPGFPPAEAYPTINKRAAEVVFIVDYRLQQIVYTLGKTFGVVFLQTTTFLYSIPYIM